MLAAVLAALPWSARAVDPSLHNLPPAYFQSFIAEPSAAPYAAADEDADGVDVREIRDLGPKPRPGQLGLPAEDLWDRMRRGFSMANLDGPLVVERQAWYTARPQQIKIMVERSRRYLFHIVEELEKRGMPTELALLPMVESAYNPMAYSRARASGLWQFIPSTGKNYNLEQNWWYDARRDIVASTTAALDYLQFLYEMHGDWHLALASYNWGENAVQRAVERNRAKGLPTDYESLQMPGETRYYVPKLQALKNIIANPDALGVDLTPIPNAPYFVTVALTRDIDLRLAARFADMPVDELIALNPGHNQPVVATAFSPQLVLPADRAEAFVQNLQRHNKPLSSWQAYTFKSGDKLEKIAAEHGITVAKLREINRLSPKSRVVAGQQLLLPRNASTSTEPLRGLFQPPAVAESAAAERTTTYVVRRGDTLSSIAQRFDCSVADLKRWNHGSKLLAGQRLIVNAAAVQSKTSATPTARSPRPAAPANKTATKKPAVKPNSNRAAAKAPPARPAAPASPAQVAGRGSSS